MPSCKSSASLEYSTMAHNCFSLFSAECALPLLAEKSPKYLKLEGKHQQVWSPIPGRMNVVADLAAGWFAPLPGTRTFVNDRFYLYNSLGYMNLGHCFPSSNQLTDRNHEEGAASIVLGDDLGTKRYLYGCLRADWLNVPLIKEAGARVFSAAEVAIYPSLADTKYRIRASLGFGLNVPLNDVVTICLYHNMANFGSQPGDIEKTSYLNFTF